MFFFKDLEGWIETDKGPSSALTPHVAHLFCPFVLHYNPLFSLLKIKSTGRGLGKKVQLTPHVYLMSILRHEVIHSTGQHT